MLDFDISKAIAIFSTSNNRGSSTTARRVVWIESQRNIVTLIRSVYQQILNTYGPLAILIALVYVVESGARRQWRFLKIPKVKGKKIDAGG